MEGPSSELSEISNSSNSSQASQEETIDRVPTATDLLNDNWSYLSDFFVMTLLPQGKNGNCSYKCLLCIPKCKQVKASKTSYEALKTHMKNYHNSRLNEFLTLISKGVNHNRRKRCTTDFGETVSSPAAQPKIKDYRGVIWGKPGEPTSSRVMDDRLVDLFVDAMLPLMVRRSLFLRKYIFWR